MRSFALLVLAVALPTPVGAAEPLPTGAAVRLGELRFRAGGTITELAFSDDGTRITSVVPGADCEAILTWDAATGELVRTTTRTKPTGPRIRWGTMSIPDSPLGVVIGLDGVARVRDFEVGHDRVRLGGHFAPVTAVAVARDGKRLATASADGLIRVWDARTYRPLCEPAGHSAAVRSVCVSADSRLALSTGADGTARVWELATGREVRAFPITAGSPARFTRDCGAILLPEAERTVARDLVTGQELVAECRRAWHLPLPFALSPDGRTVALGTRDGTIELRELATGQVRRLLTGHSGACLDLAFTPDGTKLISAGADHTLLVWPVRLRDVPLSDEAKRETDAAKLWATLTSGNAAAAMTAMARLAADPSAAIAMANARLKPTAPEELVGDSRVIELLEAVGTPAARALLTNLARGPARNRSRVATAAIVRLEQLAERE